MEAPVVNPDSELIHDVVLVLDLTPGIGLPGPLTPLWSMSPVLLCFFSFRPCKGKTHSLIAKKIPYNVAV